MYRKKLGDLEVICDLSVFCIKLTTLGVYHVCVIIITLQMGSIIFNNGNQGEVMLY